MCAQPLVELRCDAAVAFMLKASSTIFQKGKFLPSVCWPPHRPPYLQLIAPPYNSHVPPYNSHLWAPRDGGGYMHPPTTHIFSNSSELRYKGGGCFKVTRT